MVKKMEISNRLQEERKRIGLTQEVIAERLRTTKRSVINWEGGVALPGADMLSRYAAAGVDVLYVLTGTRTPQVTIPPDQQVLLSSYERCQPEAKQHLIQTAALLSAGMPAAPMSAGQHNTGDGAVLVGGNLTGSVSRPRVTRRGNAGGGC
jgi:transcriptional regulator with XRE-family HTH domain